MTPNATPGRSPSRGVHVLIGASGGILFTLTKPGIVGMGWWALGIGGGAGAVLGAVLYATRRWQTRGPAGEALRWIIGLGVAGLVLGLLAASVRAIDIRGLPAVTALGMLSGLGFGLDFQYRGFVGVADGPRTAREISLLWFVILITIALAGGFFLVTWRLTQ